MYSAFLVTCLMVVTQAAGPTDSVINQIRKGDIVFHVTTSGNVNAAQVQIQVLQTKKAFPFGTAVSAGEYNSNAAGGKYRDFIHQHFNWAVAENSMKWQAIEPSQGHENFQPALTMVNGLRSHGIKVRGHNLVWSVDQWVPSWVKALNGEALKAAVKKHIDDTVRTFKGLVEHWDVNNENLHGQFFQNQLHDPSYNLEIFRITHAADPTVKLFLNDYNVVANSYSTAPYKQQATQFKGANVGLYGLGVQCHFGENQDPSYSAVKANLDTLASVGLPIWATELDVVSNDENRRADFYEHALRALYGHPAVEGIMFWGFWDKRHWRGEAAALVKGDNLQLTAAGKRVLDLLENEWMTDETHTLTPGGNTFTIRGFHGDYEVHVKYQGRELTNLKQTFTLSKGASHTVNLNINA